MKIKVHVEDESVLVISGERKRDEEEEDRKYLQMERRAGKFMRKFSFPENANADPPFIRPSSRGSFESKNSSVSLRAAVGEEEEKQKTEMEAIEEVDNGGGEGERNSIGILET
ncbi:17.6 kDa class I heat shock protein-like [Dioscorea cayenensis subsp. rotundata]|uniref:17.6 kDa class I heat shock protein-like n=1 Tax=Dioscorea cayennensis subsp. rotundata TaxID=55577 RepID=A0AB40C5Y2_DIOCR|nr:17.6 kDa class I heat shock protein-like [Dioscorea cayenensis subsp. rotundata]